MHETNICTDLHNTFVPLKSHGVRAQMLAYWLMMKLDLFNYSSGKMVATRDDHRFNATDATSMAAGRVESKAVEASLKSTSTAAARLSANSTAGSLARSSLTRLSTNADLARSSLNQLSAGAAAAGGRTRPSLPTIDERQKALSRLSIASAGLSDGEVPEGMQAHVARVSNASERLRRVSAAMDMQRRLARSGAAASGVSDRKSAAASAQGGSSGAEAEKEVV